jgi:hypothetical protein
MDSIVVDSFDRCLKLAEDYGGAVKFHALFGVRGMHPYKKHIIDAWPIGGMAVCIRSTRTPSYTCQGAAYL